MLAGSAAEVTDFDGWMFRNCWYELSRNRGWQSSSDSGSGSGSTSPSTPSTPTTPTTPEVPPVNTSVPEQTSLVATPVETPVSEETDVIAPPETSAETIPTQTVSKSRQLRPQSLVAMITMTALLLGAGTSVAVLIIMDRLSVSLD